MSPALEEPDEPGAKRARQGAPPLEVDGSLLEGGGQILRMASAYAALFGVPVRISKIRAGRSKPGLAAQHLESLRLVRDVSGGTLANDRVGSCEVALTPGQLVPGSFSADPGTAGAITLMVQASLVPLLYTGGDCACDLRGGTDVAYSPPLDFLRGVLLPTLGRMGAAASAECRCRGFFPRGGGHVRLQVPRLRRRALLPIDLSQRGEVIEARATLYSTQPIGQEEPAALQAVREALARLAPGAALAGFCVEPGPDGRSKFWVDVVAETTSGALFHGGSEPRDFPYSNRAGGWAAFQGVAELFAKAAEQACSALAVQLDSGAAVDAHLCDQLILPASLAQGTSRMLVGELSLHARTALHIAELLVPGFAWREEKHGELTLLEIDGIGHPVPGGEDEPVGRSAEVAAFSAPAAEPTDVPESPPPAPMEAVAEVVAPAQRAAAATPGPTAGAAAAPPVDPSQELLRLPSGALSGLAPQALQDFRNDMRELAEMANIKVEVEVPMNRLVLSGGREARVAARADLQQVLAFYFPEGGRQA